MRIALFTENYYRGGLDTFTATLINSWPDATDEFVLICNKEYPGADVVRERLRKPCRFLTYDFVTFAGLAHRTRKNRLVNTLRLAASPLLRYLFLAHEIIALRKLFREVQSDRLLVINGGYPGGDACRAAAIAWGLLGDRPASIHNFHSIATSYHFLSKLQEDVVDALVARYTGAFVTVSGAAAESMSIRTAIPPKKVSYIYNGLAAAEPCEETPRTGQVRRELGLKPDDMLCLMLAAYEPHKGHRFLLQVFRRVVDAIPHAHFLACGYGREEEIAALREFADALRMGGNVHLLGFRNDAMELLAQSDLLLVGSQEFESFGLTCVEAMARKVPVVATSVGGLPEVVADGDGGFTVGADNVDSFAAHVINLLADVKVRKEQGEKGFARYQRFFTADKMAAQYESLLKGR